MMQGRYVQYGCGYTAPAGWENFDASPTLRFERLPVLGRLYTKNASRFPANARYGDVTRGLPVAPESCAGIYCSHILEHLSQADAQKALRNTHRYLQPGGTFRLVVPDLRQLAQAYLGDQSGNSAHRFMEATGLGRKQRARGVFGMAKDLLGNSAHLWMWDESAMAEALRQQGFSAIRRCQFGDAADPKFAEVEDQQRFDGCLAMECKK
jgi:SAM-dependent methyltransferase